MTPQPQPAAPACPALHSPPYPRGHSKPRAGHRPPPRKPPNLEEKPSSQMFSMVPQAGKNPRPRNPAPPLHHNPAPHPNQPSLAQLLEHCSMLEKELKSYLGSS